MDLLTVPRDASVIIFFRHESDWMRKAQSSANNIQHSHPLGYK